MLSEHLTRHVLLTGPHHVHNRGGIGGVIAIYARYFKPFKCLASYRPFTNKLLYIPYFAVQYTRFCWRLWQDKDIEIVHIHGAAEGSFYRKYLLFKAAKGLFSRKVIYHIHSGSFLDFYMSRSSRVQGWVREMVEGSDVVICLSEGWKRLYTRRFARAHVMVLPNVVSPPDVPVNRQRKGPLKLLFLGLIGERKGIFDLLDVFYAHKKEWAGRITLTIGGNGETDRVQQTIQEYGLEDMVTFAGWVSGAKKTELLLASDVFALPSYNEALPLSILEAMSYEMPVISTRIGGIPDMVVHDQNGFLVEPGDRDDIYACIRRMLTEDGLVEMMGRESARMIRGFYPDAVFTQLAGIYEHLLTPEAVKADAAGKPVNNL
ncbi:glycosyltransferase family 4 protein [Arsenicibacter rosenii]|nr:glycosyltransferase family 4 protein [Arsenicibacter rosenii]